MGSPALLATAVLLIAAEADLAAAQNAVDSVRNRLEIFGQTDEQIAALERLNGDAQIFREPDRVGDVPSVHPKSLLRRVKAVGPNDLRESGIRRRELAIATVFLAHVEVI